MRSLGWLLILIGIGMIAFPVWLALEEQAICSPGGAVSYDLATAQCVVGVLTDPERPLDGVSGSVRLGAVLFLLGLPFLIFTSTARSLEAGRLE